MARKTATFEQQIGQLRALYQKDPESFERLRQEMIRQTIESFPPDQRRRAYGIQFQLDATLNHYHDPVARMNKMVEIFWEQVHRFQEAVCMPQHVAQQRAERSPAKVIPLHRPEEGPNG